MEKKKEQFTKKIKVVSKMNQKLQSKKQSPIFVSILGALTAIGALSIDMFLPGLPEIKNDFHTTTSNAQLTLSLFMIGLALGNLFAGPISDATGRKETIMDSNVHLYLATLGFSFSIHSEVMSA